MKFMRSTAKIYTERLQMGSRLLDEMNTEPVLSEILDYRLKWICHVGSIRNPKINDEVHVE
jgi:hypothetical protein